MVERTTAFIKSLVGKARKRRTITIFGVLVVAVVGTAILAQAQTPPTITSPVTGQHLSIGQDDADPDTSSFQVVVTGTAEGDAEVTVEARRPEAASGGEFDTTADGNGDWSVEIPLSAGEWVLQATSGGETSSEVTVFVVLRYVFPWYDDDNAAGNWVLAANPNSADAARVEIFIDGAKRGDTLTIDPGDVATPRFNDLIGGPVVVDSLDGIPLVVTQRTAWTVNDLEEVPGVYDGYLTTDSWLSWYDTRNSNGRDWIVATNFGDGNTDVTVEVGGTSLGTKTVMPGESEVFHAFNMMDGPVHVTSDEPVLATRRTLWKSDNFTEMTAIPDRWLEKHNAFTWFDAENTNGADWVLVANPSGSSTNVDITPQNSDPVSVSIDPGEVHVQTFPGEIGGPLTVDADGPVIVTQRALWSSGRSFEEVPAISSGEVTNTYWQSWYDQRNARGDWMLQGSLFCADGEVIDYDIDGPTIDHSGSLDPCEVETPVFADKMEGPLVVESTNPHRFLQSKRTLWGDKNDFMELTGIRGTRITANAEDPSALPRAAGAVANPDVEDFPNDDGTNAMVSWDESGDATVDGYWVYRIASPPERVALVLDSDCSEGRCSTVVGDLPYEGEDLTFQIRPLSMATVEGQPAEATGTLVDNPPAAPSGLEGTSGDMKALLDWDDNTEEDLDGYNVYRATDGSGFCGTLGEDTLSFTKLTGSPIAVSEYEDTGLTNGTTYCYRVTAVDDVDQEGESSSVAVTPAAIPPEVTVTAPNGGEVIKGGSTFEITWTDDDPDGNKDRVRVEYSLNGGSSWVVLDDSTPNDGSFSWSVPQVDSDEVLVRVTATDQKGNTDADTSDANATIDSTDPSVSNVVVTEYEDPGTSSEDAGATFRGGDNAQLLEITWDASDANEAEDGIDIFFSTDGGSTRSPIDSCQNHANDGSCDWLPGDIDSDEVVVIVRLSDEVSHTGEAQSDTFEIDSTPPPIPVITTVDGQAVDADDPEPQAQGDDSSPETVVEGGSAFVEGGSVRIYVGSQPANCDAEPEAAKGVAAGDPSVTFNPEGGATDFTIGSEGNRSFWVCMIDRAGNQGAVTAEGDDIVYRLDTTAPSQPTGLEATPGSSQVALDWDDNPPGDGVDHYRVWRAVDPNQSGPSGCAVVASGEYSEQGTPSVSEFTDTGLTAGTRYCYRVSAVDGAGNEGPRSDPVAAAATA